MDLLEAVRDTATIRYAPRTAETLERAMDQHLSACLVIEGKDEVPVPLGTMQVIASVSRLIQNGDGRNLATLIKCLLENEEMTTQGAADFLRVSRPYVISLTDSGQLPFRMVGNRRKIKVRDILELQRKEEARRNSIMEGFRKAEALPIPEDLTPPDRFEAARHEGESDEDVKMRQSLLDSLFALKSKTA